MIGALVPIVITILKQVMNHEKVSVLDGGLPRYQMEGLALDETPLSSEEEALARIEQVCIRSNAFFSQLILWNAVG